MLLVNLLLCSLNIEYQLVKKIEIDRQMDRQIDTKKDICLTKWEIFQQLYTSCKSLIMFYEY